MTSLLIFVRVAVCVTAVNIYFFHLKQKYLPQKHWTCRCEDFRQAYQSAYLAKAGLHKKAFYEAFKRID